MLKTRFISFLFFSNYFIGILAVALSVETIFQLRLPANSVAFYILLFCITVVFYTRAYIPVSGSSKTVNPRINWYKKHTSFIIFSQWILTIISIVCIIYQLMTLKNLSLISLWQWCLLISIPAAGSLYYGLWYPGARRLRNIGWLKPFLIGYVWAGVVCLLPVWILTMEEKIHHLPAGFMFWLFVKNWMFCTVNAILFDLKDYADDANREIKTFVVRVGLRKTIFTILVPLTLTGFLSFLFFSLYNHFHWITILINTIPFVLLLAVAFSMQKRKSILYYLVVIDGILLVKAFCGITAAIIPSI